MVDLWDLYIDFTDSETRRSFCILGIEFSLDVSGYFSIDFYWQDFIVVVLKLKNN